MIKQVTLKNNKYGDIDEVVNAWFEKHLDIEIISTQTHIINDSSNMPSFYRTILYKEF